MIEFLLIGDFEGYLTIFTVKFYYWGFDDFFLKIAGTNEGIYGRGETAARIGDFEVSFLSIWTLSWWVFLYLPVNCKHLFYLSSGMLKWAEDFGIFTILF